MPPAKKKAAAKGFAAATSKDKGLAGKLRAEVSSASKDDEPAEPPPIPWEERIMMAQKAAAPAAPSPAPAPSNAEPPAVAIALLKFMETQSALSKAESPEKTAAGSALNAVRTSPEKASSSSAPAPPPPPPPPAPAPVPAGPSDADLVEELKIARKALATQHKAMTTMIADTATLERIAQVKPRNMKELEEAAGFGKTRSERYGQPLLDCVAKHLEAIKAAGGSIGGDEEKAEQSPAAATDATASSSSTKATGAGASSSNDDDFIGEVTIVYSHYKDKFGLRLGNKLDFALVDAKYFLSAVF